MPIYEYKCRKCGEHFERRQTLSDEPLKSCEKCGGGLEKQWSLSGFQFKGAGWYVTDYAGKKSGAPDTSTKSEKGSGGESTEKSSDASKPTTDTTSVVKTDGGSKKE
ncbi:MAG: zinc ribbon domain-containing protein [Acidobacteriota bacterium]